MSVFPSIRGLSLSLSFVSLSLCPLGDSFVTEFGPHRIAYIHTLSVCLSVSLTLLLSLSLTLSLTLSHFLSLSLTLSHSLSFSIYCLAHTHTRPVYASSTIQNREHSVCLSVSLSVSLSLSLSLTLSHTLSLFLNLLSRTHTHTTGLCFFQNLEPRALCL